MTHLINNARYQWKASSPLFFDMWWGEKNLLLRQLQLLGSSNSAAVLKLKCIKRCGHPQKDHLFHLMMAHKIVIDSCVCSQFPSWRLFTSTTWGQGCIMRCCKRVIGSPWRKRALPSVNAVVTIHFQSMCSKPSAFKERTWWEIDTQRNSC